MKGFFKNAGAFLQKTWVWSLLAVLFFAFLAWCVGPLVAVNDYKFWESAASRLLSISVLFLMWGLAMVFVSWRVGLRKQTVENSEDGQARLKRHEQIDEERRELQVRFKSALNTLKKLSLYRGRQELPWYLLIGPQGSGKTSLLEHAGLEFPLNALDRKMSRETLGTQYCDWYFTENGVLLDTSGRYLTQSNADVDASAWSTLLGLLHKRRRTRPLNGVLITLPVQTLFGHDQETLSALSDASRAGSHAPGLPFEPAPGATGCAIGRHRACNPRFLHPARLPAVFLGSGSCACHRYLA